MNIDPALLDRAIDHVARQEMEKKIRDWFALTAPAEIIDIYNKYQELVKENKDDDRNA